MKRKLFSICCCFILFLTIFTSCKQEVKIMEMVTITYVSEFETFEKEVVKGYKLTTEDLHPLSKEGFTFDKWYINKKEAKVNTVINENTILIAKWNKKLDKTPPIDVIGLTAKNLNGTIALKWTDPSDKDLLGIEISYAQKDQITKRAIQPIDTNSIMVAPKNQYIEFSNLTPNTAYIFTVKSVDLAGNKSNGMTVNCTTYIKTGTPLQITLTQNITVPTNKAYDVDIEIKSLSKVQVVKFTKGTQNVEYFATQGKPCSKGSSDTTYNFNVAESGTYTVFAQDYDGRREVKSISIDNIDLTNPNPLIDFKASYVKETENGSIVLSWTLPTDKDLKEVILSYKDGTQIAILNKDTTTYILKNIKEDNSCYSFKAITVDQTGNYGDSKTCEVLAVTKNHPGLKTFSIPVIGTAIGKKTIQATVTGSNFISSNIPANIYHVTCKEDPTFIKKSQIIIKDDTSLSVLLDISDSSKEKKYTLNISVGNHSIDGRLNIIETSQYKTGDILLDNDKCIDYNAYTQQEGIKPIGVVVMSDYGIPLAIGLHTSPQLLYWANENKPYDFNDIICKTDKTGDNVILDVKTYGDISGRDNWKIICSKDPNGTNNAETNYPAFFWANNYGIKNNLINKYKSGWFIPSLPELITIFKSQETINKSMFLINGNTIHNWLWSSSIDYPYKPNEPYFWTIFFQGPNEGGFLSCVDTIHSEYVICLHDIIELDL